LAPADIGAFRAVPDVCETKGLTPAHEPSSGRPVADHIRVEEFIEIDAIGTVAAGHISAPP